MKQNRSTLVIALDLDGTIIETGRPLSNRLAGILQAIRQRYSVVICTGRHPLGVKFAVEELLDFIPTVSLNGAGLSLHSWERFDQFVSIPEDVVAKLVSILAQHDVTYSVYGPEWWAVNRYCAATERESKVTGMTPILFSSHHIAMCGKVLVIGNSDKLQAIQELIVGHFDGSLKARRSHTTYLEIGGKCVDKTTPFGSFMEFEGIKSRENARVLFVGDSETDIELAKYADESWTFSKAPPELKAHCEGILSKSNGEGLAELLSRLI